MVMFKRLHPTWTLLVIATLFNPLAQGQNQGRTGGALSRSDLYPRDRVLAIKIEMSPEDWDMIRRQRRDFRSALGGDRKEKPPESPYTYVTGSIEIDGHKLPKVGIRKKGFFGSQSSTRPSLKIKLHHVDKKASIDGIKSLTLNNNRQDASSLSQFMSYALFEEAGLPAPRCALANVHVNGKDLGIYSFVESARRPLARRAFGDDSGTLFEGTVSDLHPGWEGAYDRKFGPDKTGRARLRAAIKALEGEVGDLVMGSETPGRAWVPTSDACDKTWMQPNFDDSSWIEGSGGAGYEGGEGFESHFGKSWDFTGKIAREQTSLYMRIPFDVADPEALRSAGRLTLRMKYDDGFVVYLNGKPVARANAPETPGWDSSATGAHDDAAASSFSSFDIAAHAGLLAKGRNVLAIHGMNANKFSSDMLFAAELRINKRDVVSLIGEVVDLDQFYRFWAMEGLLGAWDGYSGNSNNYFVYVHPEDGKLHFLPWGADAMFQKFSMIDRRRDVPLSVKTKGLLSYHLYATPEGRRRYEATLRELLDRHWDEARLVAEADRIDAMLKPFRSGEPTRSYTRSRERTLEFIQNRKQELLAEIKDGMPEPGRGPSRPMGGFGGGFGGGGNRNRGGERRGG